MSLFERATALSDRASGVRGFIVEHSTARGPATGGIRLYPYASEEDALADGIRLARAMTLKAAAAELPVGGGKIVLFTPPPSTRRDALAFVGRAIESMRGRFLAGRDVGLPVDDGAIVRAETSYMVDESDAGVGDLNASTALGVLAGIKAAVSFRLGADTLEGVRVAIQGAGGVGAWLARKLVAEGAELAVSDTSPRALRALEATVPFRVVGADAIYEVRCDVFAPCAIGEIIDENVAERLRAGIVAGSANNVLASPAAGEALHARGVLFVPDFLINAGALIQGTRFLLHGERRSDDAIAEIGIKTKSLLARARSAGATPLEILRRELAAEFDREHGFTL